MILFTLFRFAFASASGLYPLTSHHIVTRRPVLQKVRDHTLNRALSACKLTVSGSLSLPSRGSFHLSLTVLFAIGHMVVFSLWGWSPFLPSRFLVSRRTPDSTRSFKISSTGMSPSLLYLSRYFDYPSRYYIVVLTPKTLCLRFGLFRFRSPLLSESLLFSFPPGT